MNKLLDSFSNFAFRNKNFIFLSFLIVPLLWLGIVYLGSLLIFLGHSFFHLDGFTGQIVYEFSFKTLIELFSSPANIDILIRTVGLATCVTIGSAIIGFPIAYYMAKFTSPKVKIFLFIAIMLPLWSSYLVRVYSWKLILAKEGIINWFFEKLNLEWLLDSILSAPLIGGPSLSISYIGMFLVFTYIWLPFMILPIQASLERVPNSLIDASHDLGANKKQTFYKVILPLALPGIIAGSIFTFSLTLGDYIIPYIIGTSKFFIGLFRKDSINKLNQAGLGLRFGAIAGLLFLHIPLLLIILYAFTTEDKSYQFPPPGYTLKWFEIVLNRQDIWSAVALSMRIAIISTFFAIILGTLAAGALYKKSFFGKNSITILIILPIALPGIITGISLRSTFGVMGIPFSTWTIIIGHATFCMVVVYNNVVARLRRTSPNLIQASMDLGANNLQTFFYVILPNMGTAILAGGMLAFALSFDEVIVTTFTAGQQTTLPIWMFSELIRPRQRPITNVVAVFMMFITFIPIVFASYVASKTSESEGSTK